MKKITLLLAFVLSSNSLFAQKKTNGTVYIEHPAIQTVETFIKACVAGDETKMASYLTEDFKSYNGTSTKLDDKGSNKADFIKGSLRYNNELDYFSITNYPGSYPDAVEYKKDNPNDDVWVQTWDLIKGVHKETGVKIDAAAHRLYTLTKDNKIKMIINYSNNSVLDEIRASYGNRSNGTIYNHHDNINTVRKAMYAFEKGDVDKSLSYYSDDASFSDINGGFNESNTKAEIKTIWQGFLNTFEIKSIQMVGYPDYLEYEMNEGREVLSWWKYILVRKSDKKEIELLVHLSNSFDAEGKIVGEMLYYSSEVLKSK